MLLSLSLMSLASLLSLMSLHALPQPHHHHRHIVRLLLIPLEVGEVAEDGVADLAGGAAGGGAVDGSLEADVAVVLVVIVAGFDQAVGIEDQQVPWRHRPLERLVAGLQEGAERW